MRSFLKLGSLFLLIFLNIECGVAQSEANNRPKIESKKFSKLLTGMVKNTVPLIGVDELNADKDNYVILDAREIGEYKVSHIEGAKYIGYDKPDYSVVEGFSKETPIVIYCSIGVRSEKIGEQLEKLGYTNVQNLYGSIFEWANKGYDLVDNAGYSTVKVHGYNWVWGRWMDNDKFEKVY